MMVGSQREEFRAYIFDPREKSFRLIFFCVVYSYNDEGQRQFEAEIFRVEMLYSSLDPSDAAGFSITLAIIATPRQLTLTRTQRWLVNAKDVEQNTGPHGTKKMQLL